MREADRFGLGYQAPHYERMLQEARHGRLMEQMKRARQVVKAEDMPWERSRHGLIKHVLNGYMDFPEVAVDCYILVLPGGGRSGRHQHAYEECVYVLEGRGYDLHWDPVVELGMAYAWRLAEEPSRWEWEAGDFVYIPPMVAHQHVNALPDARARLLVACNRLYRAMGYGYVQQLEDADPIDDETEKRLRMP